ncbi:MAG: VacJ family lipoprotein [Gammaproteobacteria bacterium]|nr:MAG: VacJ family lipoprotein [Gammaproteobacteria bacterium]
MTITPAAGLTGVALTLLLCGCAAAPAQPTPGDPWERVNRSMFRFNEAVDRAALRPVATAYERHVPRFLRTGISNVLDHLELTTTIANDLLQLKPGATATDLGRFLVNSTVGLGGLLDPASSAGVPKNDEDFGQTLGRWGIGPGPYLMLPFLGPSTLRDTLGRTADAQVDLRAQIDIETEERLALLGVAIIAERADLLPADAALNAAFDRYAFVRDAWLQRRAFLVRDGEVEPEDLSLEDPGED